MIRKSKPHTKSWTNQSPERERVGPGRSDRGGCSRANYTRTCNKAALAEFALFEFASVFGARDDYGEKPHYDVR